MHVADGMQDQTVAGVGASGSRTLDPSYAPSSIVVADPDGNRFCICTAH